jgi:2-phosphosulfolactate phosphatase
VARHAEIVVVVDVLSFSTAVDVAVSQGARVFPYGERDEKLAEFARSVEAEPAGRRGESRFSLSPACYQGCEPDTRVVLPSVNGGVVTRSVGSRRVFAGCLRNANAVARAVAGAASVAVVPAGEQWPDGSLRPALEDWLGAGAIIRGLGGTLSAEAQAARAAFEALEGKLGSLIVESTSGRELVERGFAQDVDLACELDVSDLAPELMEGAFALAAS